MATSGVPSDEFKYLCRVLHRMGDAYSMEEIFRNGTSYVGVRFTKDPVLFFATMIRSSLAPELSIVVNLMETYCYLPGLISDIVYWEEMPYKWVEQS